MSLSQSDKVKYGSLNLLHIGEWLKALYRLGLHHKITPICSISYDIAYHIPYGPYDIVNLIRDPLYVYTCHESETIPWSIDGNIWFVAGRFFSVKMSIKNVKIKINSTKIKLIFRFPNFRFHKHQNSTDYNHWLKNKLVNFWLFQNSWNKTAVSSCMRLAKSVDAMRIRAVLYLDFITGLAYHTDAKIFIYHIDSGLME